MREVYEETNGIDWDRKVVVELSLLELQMIKDLVAVSNKQEAIKLFKNITTESCPYDCIGNNDLDLDLYDGLKEIVKRNGGVA